MSCLPKVSAGELRHRIQIQAATEAANALGELTPTWAKINGGDRWAKIEPVALVAQRREYVDGPQVLADVTHRITMRYMSGITVRHRIVYGTRTFGIQMVIDPDETQTTLELLCKESI